MENTLVIGISGKMKSGKDTVAKMLVQLFEKQGLSVKILHFADAVKEAAKIIYLLNDEDVYTQEGKASIIDGYSRLTVREVLQKLGTNVARAIHPQTWIRLISKTINNGNYQIVLIPDVRFPNEVQAIQKTLGGLVIKVDRPGMTHSTHLSETALDRWPAFTKWYSFIPWFKRLMLQGFRPKVFYWDQVINNNRDLQHLFTIVNAYFYKELIEHPKVTEELINGSLRRAV